MESPVFKPYGGNGSNKDKGRDVNIVIESSPPAKRVRSE